VRFELDIYRYGARSLTSIPESKKIHQVSVALNKRISHYQLTVVYKNKCRNIWY